jgi:hypothetical protein
MLLYPGQQAWVGNWLTTVITPHRRCCVTGLRSGHLVTTVLVTLRVVVGATHTSGCAHVCFRPRRERQVMFTEKSSAQPIGAVFENGMASPALTRSRRRSWPASLSLGSLADPILRCTLNAVPVPALMTRYRSAPLGGASIFHAMYPRWCRHTATEANAAMTAARAAIQLGTAFQSTPARNYAPGWDPWRGRHRRLPWLPVVLLGPPL